MPASTSETRPTPSDAHIRGGDVEAATRQQYPYNTFAASHVQDPLTLRLVSHPVDPATKNITLSAALEPFKIDSRSTNSV